jgi:hypothetical protein
MKKNYEIALAWLQLGLNNARPGVVDVAIEYANVLFEIDPPFRKRFIDESKFDFSQSFIQHLTDWIDKHHTRDFSPLIENLEKTINV